MILERLKHETRPYHDRLERRVNVMDANLSLPVYTRVLAATRAFHAPLEARIAAFPEWAERGLPYEGRLKTPLLELDLRALPRVPAPPAASGANLPRLDGFPEALGAAYVLEGATLGGQIISRHLERQLGLSAASGAAFYASYGARVGEMWRAFCAFLVQHAVVEADQARVVTGATRTFDAYDRWLAGSVLA